MTPLEQAIAILERLMEARDAKADYWRDKATREMKRYPIGGGRSEEYEEKAELEQAASDALDDAIDELTDLQTRGDADG